MSALAYASGDGTSWFPVTTLQRKQGLEAFTSMVPCPPCFNQLGMGFAHGPGSTPGGGSGSGPAGPIDGTTIHASVGIWTGDVPAANGDIVASGNLTTAKDLQCVDADISGDVSCVNIDATGAAVVTGAVTAGSFTTTGAVSGGSLAAGAGGMTTAGELNSTAGGATFAGTNGVQINADTGTIGSQLNMELRAAAGTVFLTSFAGEDPAVPTSAGTLGLGTSGRIPGGALASSIVSAAVQNSVGWLPVSLALNGAGLIAKYYIPLFAAP